MGILSSIVKAGTRMTAEVEARLGKTVVKTAAKDAVIRTGSTVGRASTEAVVSGGKSALRVEAERAALGVSKATATMAKPLTYAAAAGGGLMALTAGATAVGDYAYSTYKKDVHKPAEAWAQDGVNETANQTLELMERRLKLLEGAQAAGLPTQDPFLNSLTSSASQPESTASAVKGAVSTAAIAGVIIAAVIGGTMIYKASKSRS